MHALNVPYHQFCWVFTPQTSHNPPINKLAIYVALGGNRMSTLGKKASPLEMGGMQGESSKNRCAK